MGKKKKNIPLPDPTGNIEDLFDDPEADTDEFLDELDGLIDQDVEIESEDAGLDLEEYNEDDPEDEA
jgi:hypothetical protein